jgi:NADH-quinone oxidoreductase subunit A
MDLELVYSILLLATIAIAIPLIFSLAKYIGSSSIDSTIKNQPYESGIFKTIGSAKQKYSIKYYLIAILFVLFDIEIIYMYPWAVSIEELGMVGVAEMFSFIFILVLGLIYIINKKVFD